MSQRIVLPVSRTLFSSHPPELAFFFFSAWQSHLSSMGSVCPSALRCNNPVGKEVRHDPVTQACSRQQLSRRQLSQDYQCIVFPDLSGLSKLSRKVFSIVSLFPSGLLGCSRDSSARDKATGRAHVAPAPPLPYLMDNTDTQCVLCQS